MTKLKKGTIAFVCVTAGVIALFLSQSLSPAEANQTDSLGRIVGTIVERGTNKPLSAEMGITGLGEARLLLKHRRTSEQGDYLIEGLRSGQFHLVTKAQGYAVEHRDIYLKEGEILRADFQLEKVKQAKGVIRSPEGLSVSNATVKVIYLTDAVPRGSVAATYQWEAGEIKTDPEGRFAIDVHPDKPFIVEASHSEFIAVVSSPMKVEPTETEIAVNLSLVRGSMIVGTLMDESGNVVVGAQVRLSDFGNQDGVRGFVSIEMLKRQNRYARSGADGKFSFEQVNKKGKMLVVTHPNYQTFRQVFDLDSGPVTSKSVQLKHK